MLRPSVIIDAPQFFADDHSLVPLYGRYVRVLLFEDMSDQLWIDQVLGEGQQMQNQRAESMEGEARSMIRVRNEREGMENGMETAGGNPLLAVLWCAVLCIDCSLEGNPRTA